MAKKPSSSNSHKASAQPHYHQTARELQAFGTVTSVMPLQLIEPVRLEMTEQLNQLLADTMTLRDLYKKSHWQVSGATFYQLHLLFDKHYEEQSEIVDAIAERDPYSAPAQRPRRGSSATIPPAGCARGHHHPMP